MSYPDRSPKAIAERREKIIALSNLGLSIDDIALRVGVARCTVVVVRRQAGLAKPRPLSFTSAELQYASALLDDGCSLAEVARTLSRSRRGVSRRFPGRGWSMTQRDQHMRDVRSWDRANYQRRAIEDAFAVVSRSREANHG